jgi:hypothetical protein
MMLQCAEMFFQIQETLEVRVVPHHVCLTCWSYCISGWWFNMVHTYIYIYTHTHIYILQYAMQYNLFYYIVLYCIVLYDVVSYYVILYYCITRLFNLRFIYKTKWSQVVELSQRRGVDGNILRRGLTRKIFEKLGVGHQWPLTSLNLGNISSRW